MNLNKTDNIINKTIESIYLVVILLVPIVFSPETYFGFYQLPKESILHMGGSLILVLISLRLITNPNAILSRLINHRIIASGVLLVLMSSILSALFSVDINGSFWGREYGTSSYSVLTMFSLTNLALGIIVVADTLSHEKRLLLSVTCSTFIVAVLGLLQNFLPNIFETFTFYHQERIVSTTGNPIYLGSLLLLGIPLSILYFIRHHEISYNKLRLLFAYLTVVSIQISTLVLTLSRGPIAGFGIVFIVYMIAYLVFHRKSVINFLLLFIAPVLIAVLIINLPIMVPERDYFDELTERTGSISKDLDLSIEIETGVNMRIKPESFNYRGENWIGAFKLIRYWPKILENSESQYARLLVGYGPDAYVYVYPITVPIQKNIVISTHAHNFILNNIVENGLVGIMAFIFLISGCVYILRTRYLNSEGHEKFLFVALGSIILARLAEQMLGLAVISDLLYFYVLISLVSITPSYQKERTISVNISSSAYKIPVALMLIICLLLSSVFTVKNYKSTAAGFNLGRGIHYLEKGEIEKSITLFEKASKLNPHSEVIETEMFKLTLKVYLRANQVNPEEVPFILARMYERLVDFESRVPYSFNTQNFLTQVLWEMFKKNQDEFREEMVGRYILLRNLMPNYIDTQEILANILVATGEIELGKQEAELGIIMEEVSGIPSPQSWWVKAEAEKIQGDISNAIKSFEMAIKMSNEYIVMDESDYSKWDNPANKYLVLANQSLGLIYESSGDIDKARSHFKEAQKVARNTGNTMLLEDRFQ